MINEVKSIFDNVNNWLKFAEAKNGAIIALNATFIFGILKLGLISNKSIVIINYYLYLCIFMLLVSSIVALLSFVPQLKFIYIKFKKISDRDNLLYFGDIAKYTPTQYSDSLKKILEVDSKNNKLYEHYINQIVINSKITWIKFKQFDIAIWFTISAILTPIGGYILHSIQIKS